FAFDNLTTLAQLGAIASLAGGPLLAGAASSLVGCGAWHTAPDPDDWKLAEQAGARRWQLLRSSEVARSIGLAAPRLLLRLPYGRETDEVESLEFEEVASPAEHDAFLWGNSAFVAAALLAQAFLDEGWSLRTGDHLELDDVPSFVGALDGRAERLPPSEALLSMRAAEQMLDAGIMPLLSHAQRDVVRFARFQSIAKPAAPLEGAWSRIGG
ncbi:MAG TPA: type VI secretion system contractile sheath large subunit, partial [Pirellulales bacterium]|nr:type VI secretion system contractile sheath large subunit [Pirellulales bacterium]